MVMTLNSYRRGSIDYAPRKTVTEIISRWAPAHENKTGKYIKNVAKWTGFKPNQKIDTRKPSVMKKLIKAIIRQENESQPYSEAVLDASIAKATPTPRAKPKRKRTR